MAERPKAIIFDCWNTLFYVNARVGSSAWIARHIFRRRLSYSMLKRFEQYFDTRRHDDLNGVARRMLQEARLPAPPPVVKQLERALMVPVTHQSPFAESLDVLRDLRRDYKLGLVSNTSSLSFEHLQARYQLDDYFDVMTPSYRVGFIKPDRRIFDLTLDQLGVRPEEAVMVGDNYIDDVEAAEAIGMRGILVDRRGSYRNVANRVRDLRQLRQMIEG